MAPPKLNATDRYISPEVTKYYLVPAIADVDAPIRVEIDAGTDVTDEVAGSSGWSISADRVAVPDAGRKFTSRISGRVNPGESQLIFYASRDTADVRDVLARGDQTHVLILYGGDVVGQKMSVFPVEVSAVSQQPEVAGSEGERVMVDFSIKSPPGEDVAIPA